MTRRDDGRDREPEPVTITDKRRIDPETGRVRETAPGSGGAAQPGSGTLGEEPAPHDAEPDLAEEAGLLDPDAAGKGDVVEGEVVADPADLDEDAAGDPVAQELLERTADLQRLSAEYANYRRRVERDRQAVSDAAKAAVAGELLGVLDDLDRARRHGDLEGPLKSVADKLVTALTTQGLTAFGAVGDPFDPAVHEAVSHEGSGGEPVVSLVMRQGYRFGERVLRPAMVGVTEDPVDSGGAAPSEGAAPAEGTAPSQSTVPGPGAGPAPAQD